MKKTAITVLILLSFISTQAQVVDLRLFGGIGFLSITTANRTETIDGVSYKHNIAPGSPLFQFGAATTLGKRFFLQPGVTFQGVGVENLLDDPTGKEYKDEIILSAITVPLKVGVRVVNPDDENLINFRVFGGLDGQFITKVDHKTKSGLIGDVTKEDFNNMLLYADLGMGIDILFLFADAGYRIGLNPFLNSGDNSKANMLYINAGVKIGFGG
jgi:hypothetical protein